MSSQAADILQVNWQKGRCPEISGVVEAAGGRILSAELCLKTNAPAKLEKFELSLLANWVDHPDSRWGLVGCLYEIRDYSMNLAIACGEVASHGSQGFIASSRISDGTLYWVAVFRNSNPFAKCELVNGKVFAHSTIGLSIAVSLNNPADISLV